MDALTTLAIAALPVALAAIPTAAAFAAVPPIRRRVAISRLRATIQAAVDAHAAAVVPRRRHDAHCPTCGRFARVTSSSDRGVWTRCSAHGVRLRATRHIGEHERPLLVRITTHHPLDGLIPRVDTGPLTLSTPARWADFLDGHDPATAPIPVLAAA